MERKKQVEKLRKTIDKLNKDLAGQEKGSGSFSEIQKQIQGHKSELKALKLRVGYLTAWGAVGRPILYLSLALLSAILGIYFFYEEYQLVVLWIPISGLFSAVAIYRLYNIITIVEFASLRSARTVQFVVRYQSGEKSHEIKQGKQARIRLGIAPEKEDANNVVALLFFPPEFDIIGHSYLVQPPKSNHPNLKTITQRFDFIPSMLFYPIDVDVLPKKKGKYEIVVIVRAKGIHQYSTKLTLNVVK
jgi:hypothetical protein